MTELLDSGTTRVVAYLVAAIVAAGWGWRERRAHRAGLTEDDDGWWPAYWWASAAVLVAMAVGRMSEIGNLVGELGREQARSGGWYSGRRSGQELAVLLIGIAWCAATVIAVLRVPPRRRRYLPHAVGLSTLLAFAAVRVISLHDVDTVLYRSDLRGVRYVAIIELALVATTIALGVAGARIPASSEPRPGPGTLDGA